MASSRGPQYYFAGWGKTGPPLVGPQHHDRCLKDFVDEAEMINMGFARDAFTWYSDGVWKRLDINIDWRLRFSEANMHHLPFYKSDHRPLFVKMEVVPRPNRRRRPFRFEAAWLTHESFPNFLHGHWSRLTDWTTQVQNLQGALKEWNTHTFGDILKEKKP